MLCLCVVEVFWQSAILHQLRQYLKYYIILYPLPLCPTNILCLYKIIDLQSWVIIKNKKTPAYLSLSYLGYWTIFTICHFIQPVKLHVWIFLQKLNVKCAHQGEDVDYRAKITASTRDCLTRQVKEAVLIRRSKSKILNSKTEWHQPALYRVQTEIERGWCWTFGPSNVCKYWGKLMWFF